MASPARSVDVHARARNAVGELAERRRQVEAVVAAERAHDAAHVAEKELRHGLGRRDALARVARGLVARDLEVQRQRGEVVAQQVVQVPGDAGPLGQPRALREKLARRFELGVRRRRDPGAEPFPRRAAGRWRRR